jgi:hypothetical protein
VISCTGHRLEQLQRLLPIRAAAGAAGRQVGEDPKRLCAAALAGSLEMAAWPIDGN